MTVEVQESTKTLAEVVDSAIAGEDVFLVRGGRVVAKVTAMEAETQPTGKQAIERLGFLKGKYNISDDIKTPFQQDIHAMFYNGSSKRPE